MRIAIIGAGISGNVVARGLHRQHEITLLEAGDHVGGHSHTHQIEVAGPRVTVDTRFIVYNIGRSWQGSCSQWPALGVIGLRTSLY